MRSLAVLVFIAAVGGGAAFLAQKETVADGKVMAADILESARGKTTLSSVVCDDRIPVGIDGAVFHCDIAAADGSTAKIEYTMSREGSLAPKVIDSTGPTKVHTPTGDPWAN